MTSTSVDPASPRSPLPGLDGLRLLGALSVLFSHSYIIATGSEEGEPLVRVLGEGNIVGLYGVFTFFIISGFLLSRSLADRMDPIGYAVNRSLRLFPAFIVCMLVTALLIGPAFTALPVARYFREPETWSFLKMTLTTLGDTTLPGLFQNAGPVSGVVNGSLWSLQFEALSYVALLVFWIVLRRNAWVGIAALAIATLLVPSVFHVLRGIAFTLPFFAGGVVMHWVSSRFGTRWELAALCVVGVIASAFAGAQHMAFATLGAYVIVFLGARDNLASALARRIGDCSYGLYLYGWPVEQGVKQVTGTSDPLVVFAIAAPFTLALAYASFHLVEQPAMARRRSVAAAIRAQVDRFLAIVPRAGTIAARTGSLSFVAAAVLIFMSEHQWWYFVESITMMAAAALGGSLLVVAGFATRLARAA